MHRHIVRQRKSDMTEIYAEITGWAFVLLREPNRKPTMHVLGYVVRHGRLVDDAGEPYIGSPLTDIDLEQRVVRNRRGKIIALIGEPLPPGRLPDDLYVMMSRAEAEWIVADGATWERVKPASAAMPR
jgi:hypothetical protein